MTKQRFHLVSFLRNNFITGVTLLLPLFGVYWIIRFIVTKVNNNLLEPVVGLLHPYISFADEQQLVIAIKVLVFIAILGLIISIGLLAKIFIVRKMLDFGESILMRVPIVNKVYSAIQQISKTFLISKHGVFRRPVLVEYPRKGIYVPALVTSEAEGEIQKKTKKDLVSVFVPTTPNPTSGFLLFVPKNEIIDLDMSIEDCMKLTISFGGVTPEWNHPVELDD